MLKQIFFVLFFACTASTGFAQFFYYNDRYYDKDILFEAGVSVGLMNGLADVGDRKGNGFSPAYYDFKSFKLSTGVYVAVLYKSIVEGRLEVNRGTISGSDANSNSEYIKSRNLNYRSNIYEVSFIGAFHPLMLKNSEQLPAFSPYLMAGMGVFSFFPKTLYGGEYIALRRQNTEGQNSKEYARKQYKLLAVSTPIGLGVKYEYSAKFNIRLEGLLRFTNSDYIDDASTTYVDRSVLQTDLQKVLAHRYSELNPRLDRTGSPRGNPNNNDKFFSIDLKIGYVIGREKIPINYAPQ